LDKLSPSCVPWAKVHAAPRNMYQRVENCEIALAVGRRIGLPLKDIGGRNIESQHTKSVLGACARAAHRIVP
jgi:hypothetical protein